MNRAITDKFDRQKALTKFELICFDCKIEVMIEQEIRGPGRGDVYCKEIKRDCPWVKTSSRGNGTMCTAPSARIFKDCGFDILQKNSTYKIGKSHFLFFIYHPDMGWQPPQEMPERNRFGKIVDPETDCWELCHLNGKHWDDRKRNLEWKLKTEHKVTEPNTRSKKEPKTIYDAGVPK